ncbi:MAG TPA: hypothetical protein PLF24_06340 [Ruminococcus sp.]|nr:hypothetical protein [Ruminococcus sp.]
MKKLFILCLAAVMTTSFFSCGNSSKENSKKDEPKTVDFFDTIEMNVIGTYPFLVVGIDDDTFVNDESLPDMGFAFELKVTELNTDSAEIQLDIIPESFENYLNKKNMILSDKKDMTFNLAACDYDSILLSEKQLTEGVKRQIIDGMIKTVEEEIKYEKEIDEISCEIKPIEMYAVTPPDNYSFEINKIVMRQAILNNEYIEDRYDAKTCAYLSPIIHSSNKSIYVVLQDSDNEKFIVSALTVIAPDGTLNEEKTTYNIEVSDLNPSGVGYEYMMSKSKNVTRFIKEQKSTNEDYDILEIPIT